MARSKKYKLDNFFASFGAAVHLSEIAKAKNQYIEQVCLFASIIDGLLRLSLVMEAQLKNKSDNFHETYLYQDKHDKIISEKDIYKISLEKKIITKSIFKKLYNLYDKRNKIIHRYVISDIKTLSVKNTAVEYEIMLRVIQERHRPFDSKIKLQKIGLGNLFIENPSLIDMAKQIMPKHKGVRFTK